MELVAGKYTRVELINAYTMFHETLGEVARRMNFGRCGVLTIDLG